MITLKDICPDIQALAGLLDTDELMQPHVPVPVPVPFTKAYIQRAMRAAKQAGR